MDMLQSSSHLEWEQAHAALARDAYPWLKDTNQLQSWSTLQAAVSLRLSHSNLEAQPPLH